MRRIVKLLPALSTLLLLLTLTLEAVAAFDPRTFVNGDWQLRCHGPTVTIVRFNPDLAGDRAQVLDLWCVTIARGERATSTVTSADGTAIYRRIGHFDSLTFGGWRLPLVTAILPALWLVFHRRKLMRRGLDVLPLESNP